MCFAARRAPGFSLPFLTLLVLAAIALEGCSKPSREDEYSKNNAKPPAQEPVAKFAGRVTVDGLTQLGGDHIFVFLTDPQKLDKHKRLSTRCDPDGRFEFKTYLPGDGVPLGKYVVGFVALHLPKKATGMGTADSAPRYLGPDGLKNLYNDPEKNKDIPEFVVEVTQPGRTDYEFNLTVSGKEQGSLGRYAVKSLGDAPADL